MSTGYPKIIDGNAQLPLLVDGRSPIKADDFNRIRNAIVAVEKELGINPSGDSASVTDRLAVIESVADGYLAASLVTLEDLDGYFVSSEVESVLAEIYGKIQNISLDAVTLSIADVDGYFSSSNAEGALQEAAWLMTSTASDVQFANTDGYYSASTNVEEALKEVISFQLGTDFISGMIEFGQNRSYRIMQGMPFPAKIISSSMVSGSGTVDGYIYIANIQMDSSYHNITTNLHSNTYSLLNAVEKLETIDIVLTNNSFAKDISFTIVYEVGASAVSLFEAFDYGSSWPGMFLNTNFEFSNDESQLGLSDNFEPGEGW